MTFPLALLISTLTGFTALSSELLWYRAWSFASGARAGAFGALLGFYLLGIAVGSVASRRLCRDRDPDQLHQLLRPIALLVGAASALGFCLIPVLTALSRLDLGDARHPAWHLALPLVAVATSMSGAIFPLVSHAGIAPDERAGARVSYLYMANIVGCAAGSLLTGFVLMDIWSLRAIATALAWGGLLIAVGVLLLARPTRRDLLRAAGALGAAALAVGIASEPLYHNVYEKLQLGRRYDPAHPFARVVENRNGVITVTDDGLVFGGGAYDGAFRVDLNNDRNGIYRAFALAAIHPAPRQVLMIGLSSGSWARVIAALPAVEQVTVVEINPGYLDLIPLYPGGRELLSNPKVKIVIDDGRRWLRRHPDQRFDAVVANTTFHWRAHSTNLLSREFMQLVRDHLAPGGLFYFNTTSSEIVQKTAAAEFPYGLRIANCMAAADVPIAVDRQRWRETMRSFRLDGRPLLNSDAPADAEVLDRIMALTDDVNGADTDRGLETHPHLLARLATRPILTDDNMLTEW